MVRRASLKTRASSTRVVHIGVVGDIPGGMAQVVNEYLSWSFDRVELSAWASTTGKHDPKSALRWGRTIVRVVGLRLSRRKAVIVVHLSQGGSFIREGSLIVLARTLGLPAVAHLHGSDFEAFAAKSKKLVSFVLRKASKVLVLTSASARVVERRLGSSPVPVSIVSNAVRLSDTHQEKNNLVIFAGEVGQRKGADVLIEAWTKIDESIKSTWKLHICGPLAEGFRPDVKDDDDRIELHGAVDRALVGSLLGRAKIAVLPSRHEALPMFLLEAMAHRVAAVSTPVGEIEALLADGAGVLTPVGDSTALSAALSSLMRNPRDVQNIADTGLAKVESTYSSEVVSSVLEEEWLSVVHDGDNRDPLTSGRSTLGELGGKKALLVASTGGHLAQLDKLHASHLRVAEESTWVTFENEQSRSILSQRKVFWLPYIPSRGWRESISALPKMFRVLRRSNAEVVVSTGAAIAMVALPMARLMGKKVHYIESVSRFDGPSLTGRMISYFPGIRLHTQHPNWASKRWVNDISLLDDYRIVEAPIRGRAGTDAPTVFVTLGTIKPYRFDALVDRLMEILPSGARVTWQVGETERKDLPGDVRTSMSSADMDKHLSESDYIISHAGVGTALRAMDLGRRPVLVPRRSARGEHVDDHQIQIARELAVRGLAIASEVDDLTFEDLVSASAFELEFEPAGTEKSESEAA
jgi:UDP-N-acetylglucosamine--N-acetylmuramyl-(pentapeptide) pyrophosphoryl-undecaprenol N-acetylglucosamine transferase